MSTVSFNFSISILYSVSKSGLTKVKQQDYVSLDKSPPSYFVEGIEKLNLLQQLCNLNYFTLHRKSICIFDKSQIYSLERN